MNHNAKLILIPTPIGESTCLEDTAFNLLLENALRPDVILLMEEPKASRRNWLSYKLPREAIEKFVYLNEQSTNHLEILDLLSKGKKAFLMCDGGLPAYCDPGQKLIKLCHEKNLAITSTPFCNSISLAIALSGVNCNEYNFRGFIKREKNERLNHLTSIIKDKGVNIFMDTPYRLKKTLSEIEELERNLNVNNKYFLATDLNFNHEELIYGNIKSILKKLTKDKAEFILIKE